MNQTLPGKAHFISEALAYSLELTHKNLALLESFPEWAKDGKWICVDNGGWVGGHWAGLLWLAYLHTGDPKLESAAGSLAGGSSCDLGIAVAQLQQPRYKSAVSPSSRDDVKTAWKDGSRPDLWRLLFCRGIDGCYRKPSRSKRFHVPSRWAVVLSMTA